jgi:hypothetical protein
MLWVFVSKIDDCGRARRLEEDVPVEFALTSIGIGDFIGFVGIKPDLLATS